MGPYTLLDVASAAQQAVVQSTTLQQQNDALNLAYSTAQALFNWITSNHPFLDLRVGTGSGFMPWYTADPAMPFLLSGGGAANWTTPGWKVEQLPGGTS